MSCFNLTYMEQKFHVGMNINMGMQINVPFSRSQRVWRYGTRQDNRLWPFLKVTNIITDPNITPSVWIFYISVSKTMRYRALLAATSFVAAFSWDNFMVCTKIRLEFAQRHDQILVESTFFYKFISISLIILQSYAEVEQFWYWQVVKHAIWTSL